MNVCMNVCMLHIYVSNNTYVTDKDKIFLTFTRSKLININLINKYKAIKMINTNTKKAHTHTKSTEGKRQKNDLQVDETMSLK